MKVGVIKKHPLYSNILVAQKALNTMVGHVKIKFGNAWSTKTKKIGAHQYKFFIV